jgi:hypothetical protein
MGWRFDVVEWLLFEGKDWYIDILWCVHLKATVCTGIVGLGPNCFFFILKKQNIVSKSLIDYCLQNLENNVTHIVRNIIIHLFSLFCIRLYCVRFEVITVVTEEYSPRGCNVMYLREVSACCPIWPRRWRQYIPAKCQAVSEIQSRRPYCSQ